MKKILLSFFLSLAFCSSYSQELYLGKTTSEIQTYITHKATLTTLYGKKAICEEIDTNITDVYLFNNDVCIEYSRLSKNKIEIDNYLSSYFKQSDEVWLNLSVGLVARVVQVSSNLYKISFRKY